MHSSILAPAANIARHLSEMATLQPTRPAIICANARDTRGEVAYEHMSFAQLEETSNHIAQALDAKISNTYAGIDKYWNSPKLE